MPSRHDFMARLSHLKACSEPSSSSKVQVMTIHKAKGLEFDTVIIPGLERATRGEDQAMLLWQELIDKTGQHRLLLAPIKSAGEKADQMYRYLYINEQEKSAFEAQRLLYVAVTRAKKRLYLFATVEQDEAGGIKSPPKRSQLASLWSTLQNECEDQVSTGSIPSVESLNPSFKTSFNRLPTDWQLSGVESFFAAQKPVVEGLNIPDPFLPETNLVRAIGTVVHLYLAQISLEGLHDWTAIAIHSRQEIMKAQLRSLGVLAHDLDAAVNEVLRILNFSVDDQRGRWVLSAHAQAKSEYALMSKMNGKLCKFIIDRTFIDEQGRRWIIDYKSSRPTNSETIAAFLAREKQTYLSQLNTYARLLMKQDPKLSIVHCGLYFPALEKGWVSWEYTSF